MSFPIRFPGTGLIPLGLVFLLAACAGTKPGEGEQNPNPKPAEMQACDDSVEFQLVYIVHGDANYSYHDSTGRERQADHEALIQAQDMAEHSPRSEVFIFHQRTRRPRLFGRDLDGTFYQYRCGERVHQRSYSREGDSDLQEESRLYHQYRLPSTPRSLTGFLFYFGHEIPLSGGENYSSSFPDQKFSQPEFTRGLGRFQKTEGIKPFSLAVLSTCYGGSPSMLTALSPYTRYVVASPTYLHLSYLDTRALKSWTAENSLVPDSNQVHALADSIANQSFLSLQRNTQTEITVALYDMNKASPSELFPEGWRTQIEKYHDCALDPGFNPDAAREGVEMYYRAPRFGASKYKTNHSGWECPGKSFVFEKENTLPHAFEFNGTQDIPENSFDTPNSRSQP